MSHGSRSSSAFNPNDPRRRATRHSTDALECDLGQILDLSKTGMRIVCRKKPPLRVGQSARVRIHAPEGTLPIPGRVVWIKRKGLRGCTIGIHFEGLTERVATALDSLGQFGLLNPGGKPSRQTATKPRASLELPDYYGILNVTPAASKDQIRRAYHKLAQQFHPDVTTDPEGPKRFQEVCEAYDVLRDTARRRQYDSNLEAAA